jgi:hypothetical protein
MSFRVLRVCARFDAQRCLDGRRVEFAHELADVLPLAREPAAAGDALGEEDGVVQGFGQVERDQVGFLECDQACAKVLGSVSVALARALAGAPIFVFLVFAAHRTILPCRK